MSYCLFATENWGHSADFIIQVRHGGEANAPEYFFLKDFVVDALTIFFILKDLFRIFLNYLFDHERFFSCLFKMFYLKSKLNERLGILLAE